MKKIFLVIDLYYDTKLFFYQNENQNKASAFHTVILLSTSALC